jgi:drug/metabolite transporter (DMT)-like permease
LTLTVTLLVLLAAVLHAAWNAMVKSTGDRLVMMAWIAGSTSALSIPIVIYTGMPVSEAWYYLFGSALIHTAYMSLLVSAYTHGDYGQVYPLARGVAPAIVTIAGFLIVDEALSWASVLGICLIVGGIVSLSLRKSSTHAIGYALATGLAIAAYSVVDGIGGRITDTPLNYIGWIFLIHGIPFTLITIWRRGLPAMFASRRVALTGMGGAAMSMIAYGIVIWAMNHAPLGPVSALRETSVVFGALISGFILKEGLGRLAIAAAGFVMAGVVLLRLA